MNEPSFILVLSGPAGVGKTTVCERLIGQVPDVVYSVSATTRPPRPDEVDGVDYLFVGDHEFDRTIRESGFLEWAEVHGYRYGTPSGLVKKSLNDGKVVLMDVDVQGGESLMRLYPDGVSIFLLPPSFEVLADRLRGRATETQQEVEKRLARAREEMARLERYTYRVVNDELEEAVEKLKMIVSAERCRVSRWLAMGG
jgi:guanylate kinase